MARSLHDNFGAKLQAVKIAICHKDCPDGVASAVFLQDSIPGIEIRFMLHNTPEHKELDPKPGMLFCDFTPHPDRYKEFVKAGTLVLDHHKLAQELVEDFGDNGVFGDEDTEPGVCGAYLAYREVWCRFNHDADSSEKGMAEDIARLAGIRDTWQRDSPEWEEACRLAAAMTFYTPESWLSKLHPFDDYQWLVERIETGRTVVDKTAKAVDKAIAGAYHFMTLSGTKVAIFPGTKESSDAADKLGTAVDLVVGFSYYETAADGIVTLGYSTRSKTGFNCGAFGKSLGGGGHTAAAGFSTKFDADVGAQDPYNTFRILLEDYEDCPPIPLL